MLNIIDEQVDTVGRAFMGLTLGCARCHDHKFDPLTAHDYHGLAGIFKSTKTMEHFRKIARWHENPLASEKQIEAKKNVDRETGKLKDSIKKLSVKTDADGSFSEGFRMKQLPQAIAGAHIHMGTIAGKLNGVMPATTPSGWRIE